MRTITCAIPKGYTNVKQQNAAGEGVGGEMTVDPYFVLSVITNYNNCDFAYGKYIL